MKSSLYTAIMVSAFMFMACSNDSSGNNPPEESVDPQECLEGDENCQKEPEICEGDECEKPEDPKECNNTCKIDDKKCDGDILYECVQDEKDCLDWAKSENCADAHKFCDTTTLSCEACAETCPEAGKRCGSSNSIESCSADENGCAVWNTDKKCESVEHCDESSFECVKGCEDVCEEGKKKCDGTTILSCEMQENGCTDWKLSETCEFAKMCYGDDEPKCEYACGDECKPFTLVIMPDTQNYVRTTHGIFKNQTEWLRDNKEQENIKFIMHMGDTINNNDSTNQYPRAIEATDVLGKNDLHYSIATGNHDYKVAKDGTKKYGRSKAQFATYYNDEYFKKSFSDTSWFGGFHYDHSMYATFEVGHLKFVVFALEFRPRKEVLCWVDDMIRTKFQDRYVIITTHAFLDYDSSNNGEKGYDKQGENLYYEVPNGANGNELFNELAARHSNVIMVACGHNHDAEHRFTTGHNGNTVYEALVDYQTEPYVTKCPSTATCKHQEDGGNGWLRLLRINPINKQKEDGSLENNVESVIVRTLDNKTTACTKMYCTDDYDNKSTKPDHQYNLTFDFSKPIDYKYSINKDYSFTTNTINNNEKGKQTSPAIAVNRETGSYVAVWNDNDKDYNVEARIFCAGGCKETDQFTVNPVKDGNQKNPDIAMDKAGNFVVVWEGDDDGDGNYEIFMRGYDAKGNERIKTTQVNSVNTGNQKQPAIGMNSEGSFVVVWHDESDSNNGSQIHMHGFKADGSEAFSDKLVIDPTKGNRTHPDVAVAEDGTFIVVWQDDEDNNSSYQIVARGFKADGSENIATFTVNTVATGQQRYPKISMNASGNFFIAWADDRNAKSAHTTMVRGFDSTGKETFADKILSESSEKISSPDVCLTDDNRAIVSWSSTKGDDYGNEVYRRTVKADGSLGSISRVNYLRHGSQDASTIGCASDGRHVVLFVDDTMSTGTPNIYGRGFN